MTEKYITSSKYFNTLNSLINSEELIAIAKKYDYEIMSIDDAEYKYDLEPCQYCLQKNLKHQYDIAIPFVAILYYVIIYFTSKRVAAIFQKS